MKSRAISIIGARENTLRDVTVDLPKDRLIVITGRSGSGKSSLAVDTIFAEAQRELADGLSSHIRTYLSKTHRPAVADIRGLAPTVLVSPIAPRGTASSTVGTVTDLWTGLRDIFAALGSPRLTPSEFSFNTVAGACPTCQGAGQVPKIDDARLIDPSLSIAQGGIRHPAWDLSSRYTSIMDSSGLIDIHRPIGTMSAEMRHTVLWAPQQTFFHIAHGVRQSFTLEGVCTLLLRRHRQARAGGVTHDADAEFVHLSLCPACGGTRLKPEALAVRLGDLRIVDCAAMPLHQLVDTFHRLAEGPARDKVEDLCGRVQTMCTLGLGHLSLDRPVATLSGGEAQRVKLARHLSSKLSHMIFVVDEPAAGLHLKEVRHLIDVLRRLRDKPNTVIVIDHHEAVLRCADLVVEMGPGAGREGGRIVAMGTPAELATNPETLTAKVLAGDYAIPLDHPRRTAKSCLQIRGAHRNNLKAIDLDLPLGVLTCLVGVSGSGKTSLALDIVDAHPDTQLLERIIPGGGNRSVVATYAEVFSGICKEFATATGQPQSLFRFNGEGACSNCGGLGFDQIEMHFLDDVRLECPVCRGMRYGPEALRHTWRDHSILDVLNMTVEEAACFFGEPRVRERLKGIARLGLGYLTLGRGIDTLSTGEMQRLSLTRRLRRDGQLLILDEPARGLHPADVSMLLGVFDDLIRSHHSLLVIEHNINVARAADWVIELGPGAGEDGGQIIAQGTPAELVDHPTSLFGRHLREGTGE